MTAQIQDRFLMGDDLEPYVLTAVAGGPLFDPRQHGLATRSFSTACWRGWHASYRLVDRQLSVLELGLGLLEEDEAAARAGTGPLLQGRAPRKKTYRVQIWKDEVWQDADRDSPEWFYEDLRLPVPFTGGMLLGRNFLRELYVHMGFHPAWKYETVVEVVLSEGKLGAVRDLSEEMAALRERRAGRDEPGDRASRAEICEWVEETFSLRYPELGR